MRGDNVACSLGALHYVAAMVILLDSIIFMFGFAPFFIIKLAPAAYYFVLTYSITAGSLFFCVPKLASVWNKNMMETIISRRQLRAYRRKRCFTQTPMSSFRAKEAPLENVNIKKV
jgi:hypothetical protein